LHYLGNMFPEMLRNTIFLNWKGVAQALSAGVKSLCCRKVLPARCCKTAGGKISRKDVLNCEENKETQHVLSSSFFLIHTDTHTNTHTHTREREEEEEKKRKKERKKKEKKEKRKERK